MSGLLTKVTSYDKEMSHFNILAKSTKEPTFLVTPIGPNFINELLLKKVTGGELTEKIKRINLKKVFIHYKAGWFGRT